MPDTRIMSKIDALSAAVGMHVVIELVDHHGQVESLEVDLVPEEAADFDKGRLGSNTPLAQALLGQVAGSKLPYIMGDVVQVRILDVSPAQTMPAGDAAERRREALRKALDAAERTNAAMFAASFSGKWGDYDPKGIDNWEE